MILDKRSQKNLMYHALVNKLQIPTTSHPFPYHLGWVKKVEGPCLLVYKCFVITFSIGYSHNTIECDMIPLNYYNLLFRIPY
jgi:hypothetical protein